MHFQIRNGCDTPRVNLQSKPAGAVRIRSSAAARGADYSFPKSPGVALAFNQFTSEVAESCRQHGIQNGA